MSFLSNLIGGGVVSAAEGVANIIDRFVETEDEKRAAELIKAKMMMKPSLAQVELNKIEAQHRSVFVAGWRPFIGWVCGCALAWHFIGYDLLRWLQAVFWPDAPAVPELSGTGQLISIVLSLLGLGAFRTVEKFGGRTK